jgi:hypothetical protein
MRGVLFASLVACFLTLMPASHAAAAQHATAPAMGTTSIAAAPVFALAQDKKIDITIGDRGGAWYRSPVWIAIGVLAIVVLLLIVVLIARGGGGTTIVKD